MASHRICNNCGEFYETIYTDSPDDTTTFPDNNQNSSFVGTKNKIDRRSYRYQCPFCGAVKPKVSYNEENELTYRAFQLLAEAKFDEANAAFDEVLAKYPENVEAYWGKVKVKYRVLYKKNKDEKMLPTCEKTIYGSVFKDENYQKAFQYADERIQNFLKKQANTLDRIRGIKAKKAAVVTLASCMVIGAGSFGAYQIFRHRHTLGADATCTEAQLCIECGAEVNPALGHTSEWVTVIPATTTEEGLRAYRCTACGMESATESIPATTSEGLVYTVNADQVTCTITNIGTCKDTELVIPETIDGYKVTSIGNEAFKGCASLTSIDLPNSVTSIGSSVFYGCTSLTSIEIPDSVARIGDYAFSGCTSLTIIVIPDSVTSIGDSAFFDCTSLTSITIPDGVTSIGDEAFCDCESLTSITIPDSVTSIGNYAFWACTSLTSITIPDSVTSIGDRAFSGCESLTSITIPDGVTSIGNWAFFHCTSLTSIVIPDSVTSIGDCAFCDCTSLTSIVIPDSVTSIGDCAFCFCTSLTSIVIPDGVTSIGDAAFCDCESLTSITIPDGVTSIGEYAFCYCESLTSIVIPDSVTSIGEYAFCFCSKLTGIRYGSTTAQWQNINKGTDWDTETGDYTVICTDGTVSKDGTVTLN